MIKRNNQRITIPGSDLVVSRLCLGGVKLGSALDEDASFALLDYYIEQGGNFIDTAEIYANWLPGVVPSCSEKMLGRWLGARSLGSDVVVATKIGHPRIETPRLPRLDRASLRADVCASLANLGVSSLDLVYLHRDDPSRPVDELLGPLDEMRREGLLRYYGVSNWSADRIREAQLATQAAGWREIVANQPEWSLARRNPGSAASDLVQMDEPTYRLHERTNLAAIPYTSQAKGYFDKLLAGMLDAATARAFDNSTNAEVARTLNTLAATYNVSASSIALAVMLAAPFPAIPIIGSHTRSQVESSFRCLTIELPDDIVTQHLTGQLNSACPAK